MVRILSLGDEGVRHNSKVDVASISTALQYSRTKSITRGEQEGVRGGEKMREMRKMRETREARKARYLTSEQERMVE